MVRALASQLCGSGAITGLRGLNLLLVPFSAKRGFSPSTPALPSPQKPTFPNSNLIPISVDKISHSVEVPLYINSHYFNYLPEK